LLKNTAAKNGINGFCKNRCERMSEKSSSPIQARKSRKTGRSCRTPSRKKLSGYLKDTPFQLISVVVGDINYPKVVSDAMEKKLAAQQLLEEKETQKEIMKKDAEIRIEEARGIAEAQKIINATLTPNYLQHEAIQAQLKMAESPNHTTVYIPVGTNGIPLIETTNRQR